MFLSLRHGEIRIQVLWGRKGSSKTRFSEAAKKVNNHLPDILTGRIFLQTVKRNSFYVKTRAKRKFDPEKGTKWIMNTASVAWQFSSFHFFPDVVNERYASSGFSYAIDIGLSAVGVMDFASATFPLCVHPSMHIRTSSRSLAYAQLMAPQ